MQAFDHEVPYYDRQFTDAPIGRLQRKLVWQVLMHYLPDHTMQVLETNAGTGPDALWLQQAGHRVIPTDASSAMVERMRKKGLDAHIWDINDTVPVELRQQRYDLVFSNFSGWNCVDEQALSALSDELAECTTDKAVVVTVLFGRWVVWEYLYFFFRLQWKQIFRRLRKQTDAFVGGTTIPVWYHRKRDMQTAFDAHFDLIARYPVGSFLPPTYLQPLNRFRGLLKFLFLFDTLMTRWRICPDTADHTVYVFRRKP